MTARRLSAQAARTVIEQAETVKAPDHRETHAWQVVSGGQVLVHVEPSYGGTSRSGRNGWRWRIAGHAIGSSRPERNIEDAAVAGLGAWERWATSKETT
ncbi:hypothetical protein [Streptomyces sp. NPDC059786]|uniref:hypothetical protein n=1 Tax=Streptomyces sp. NPDC059786 TaxID=3346946 RepID=UPI00365337C8